MLIQKSFYYVVFLSSSDHGGNCGKLQRIIGNSSKLELLTDLRLITYSLAQFMIALAQYVPIVFLPDSMVKDHGILPTTAGQIIAFYGIARFVGSPLSGLTVHYLKNSAVLFTGGCLMIMGGCTIGMAFSSLYWHFVACFFIYGVALCYTVVLTPISLIELLGIDSLKISYSVIMAVKGIASLIGTPMVGGFEVLNGRYDFCFIIAGGFFFLAGIMAFAAHWKHKRKSSSTNTTSTHQKE